MRPAAEGEVGLCWSPERLISVRIEEAELTGISAESNI